MTRFSGFKFILLAMLVCIFPLNLFADNIPDNLSHLDFLYAGESKNLRMYIIKDGKPAWTHTLEGRKGEISDAIYMTDGNILVAHRYGIMEIAPDHSVVWSYDTPEDTEIHTIQPIGDDKVVFVKTADRRK